MKRKPKPPIRYDDRDIHKVIDREVKRPIRNWTKVYTDYEPYAEDLEVFHAK